MISEGHPQTPGPSTSLRTGAWASPLCTPHFHQPAGASRPPRALSVRAARRLVAGELADGFRYAV